MGCARPVRSGFSPLDEELELLPGSLSAWGHECLVRLGTWMPFVEAAKLVAVMIGIQVSECMARRYTEAAGAAQVALETEAVVRLEREAPAAPAGPAKQMISADGAYVPLVGGKWTEVKTLVIGEVSEPVLDAKSNTWSVSSEKLSYFSRLAEAQTFNRLALVETHRRGVENAKQVAAVLDGAEWLQGFVAYHRADATRILDFPHAAEYVSKIGQATYGADTPELAAWLSTQLHELKHTGPAPVLAELRHLAQSHPAAHSLGLPEALAYLEKRQAQMQYPSYQAQGWPIGSGAVESANKLVVEDRLKGAGMHWAPEHVDPMLALRNAVCNDRWAEIWPQIETRLRIQARQAQTLRLQKRHQQRLLTPSQSDASPPSPQPSPPFPPPLPSSDHPVLPSPAPSTSATEPLVTQSNSAPTHHRTHSPAPDHPWRRSPIGRARFRPSPSA